MNEIESRIAGFWRDTLNIPEVNTKDNFFHVGGHSLHAIRLKHFINTQFNVDISIKNIFDNPTILDLSHQVKLKMDPNDALQIQPEQNQLTQSDSIDQVEDSHDVLTYRQFKSVDSRPEGRNEKQIFFPVTHGEERLLFLYQYQTNKSIYNIARVFHLKGNPNMTALENACNRLIQRHENLRKQFIEINGVVTARLAEADFHLDHQEFRGHAHEREKWLENAVAAEVSRPFDLEEGLPFRATLIHISDCEFVLIIALHHIVADEWSLSILLNDLERFYNAIIHDSEIRLPSLALHYRNYPLKQREQLTSDRKEALVGYWKSFLKERVHGLKLPYDYPPQELPTYEGAIEEGLIPDLLAQSLAEIAKKRESTLFMLFLAAFHTLLYKYTRLNSIATGIPIVNRPDETKELVGFFANTLIVATDFNDDLSFNNILDNVKNSILDAHENQDLPFDILVNELRKETGLDSQDLVQVMFAFQNNPNTSFKLEGLKLESMNTKTTTAKFDLTVTIVESKGDYEILIEYRTARFTDVTVRRIINCYLELLYSIVRDPSHKISELEWVSGDEKEMVVKKWNQTTRPIPRLCVHEIFEIQVEDTPDEMALDYDGELISYRELNNRSNQLAWHLIEVGLTIEEPVGILMEESDLTIISQLGIMKAGGAYLPLDPSYPQERLVYMLQSAGAKKIVTNSRYAQYVANDPSLQLIIIEKGCATFSEYDDSNPKLNLSPFSLSNIMFTSGSTGKPKAAALEHIGIIRLVINVDYLKFNSQTKLLKTGAFTFDASTLEVWGPLLNGGRVYLCSRENILDHGYLKNKIAAEKINMMWFTTSWFNQLAEIDPSLFNPLQKLLVGGDKLSARHINKVKNVNPHLETINAYGPTENSVFSTFYIMNGEQSDPVPIGRPVPNTTVYVLDDQKQIQPVGIEGEIYVGGLGVARGYINNLELSTRNFLPDPFQPGGRLYRTGDTGRWLNNGTLEFVGRKDSQIKLRGFRIEIGEIEHALSNHPRIKEAVVVVHYGQEDDKQLIAFYESDEEIPSAEIRNFLRQVLPEHMVPSQLIRFKNFPLTAHGKIDRTKLIEKIDTNLNAAHSFEPPANSIEKQLAEIWEDVLSRKPISVTESFFHLGGHSLLATRLMYKIKNAFRRDYPISLLFKTRTIRAMASTILKELEQTDQVMETNLVPIQPKGSQLPLFVIPGYLFYYHLAKYLGDDQPLYGFEPQPDLTVEESAALNIKQLKRIQPDGPYYLGGYCAGGIVAFEMARQLTANGETVGFLAMFEVYTSEGIVSKTSVKYLRERLSYLTVNLRAVNFQGKLKVISKEIRKLGRSITDVFRSRPSTNYIVKPYHYPIILFRAIDGMVGAAEDQYMGWSKYCPTENLTVIDVPGNHDTMFKEPHVSTLARHVESRLIEKRMERNPVELPASA